MTFTHFEGLDNLWKQLFLLVPHSALGHSRLEVWRGGGGKFNIWEENEEEEEVEEEEVEEEEEKKDEEEDEKSEDEAVQKGL